jgi:hypothetical protein
LKIFLPIIKPTYKKFTNLFVQKNEIWICNAGNCGSEKLALFDAEHLARDNERRDGIRKPEEFYSRFQTGDGLSTVILVGYVGSSLGQSLVAVRGLLFWPPTSAKREEMGLYVGQVLNTTCV